MSDKGSKSVQNKSLNTALKWGVIVLTALVLEVAAIFSAVKITEMRGKADSTKLQNIYDKISSLQMQINVLEKLPASISAISQQVGADAQGLNTLFQDFNLLKEETGDNKVPEMIKQMAEINHRIEVLEENSRGEALILNLALIIKENVLYQRSFVQEADLLTQLSQNHEDIKPYADTINGYRNQKIQNNLQLAQQYTTLSQSFTFTDGQEASSETEEQGAVAKGVKMLKNTVANINFDRVVVLKKDKLTKQQKELIEKLDELVANYNYKEALEVIKGHPELKSTNSEAFARWQQEIADKLNIEDALNALIIRQLGALREDIKENKLQKNITQQKEINENPQPAINEPTSEETVEILIEETTND